MPAKCGMRESHLRAQRAGAGRTRASSSPRAARCSTTRPLARIQGLRAGVAGGRGAGVEDPPAGAHLPLPHGRGIAQPQPLAPRSDASAGSCRSHRTTLPLSSTGSLDSARARALTPRARAREGRRADEQGAAARTWEPWPASDPHGPSARSHHASGREKSRLLSYTPRSRDRATRRCLCTGFERVPTRTASH